MTTIEFLRQFRIGGFAIFDFAVSFIAVYFLAPFLSKLFRKMRIEIPKRNWLFLTIPLSILIHVIVGTITPLTRDFLDLQGHPILKVVVVLLTVFGVRGVRILKKK
ncbi:MAG: hypothetical protein NUV81_00035 [bacterium]|nr:hypothetical protein [bacterium]